MSTESTGRESQFDYLRLQIRAFENLKDEFDLFVHYDGPDEFRARKSNREKNRLESAMDRRYKDIVAVAENVFNKQFREDNKSIVVVTILKLIGGMEPKPVYIDRTDRVNVLR